MRLDLEAPPGSAMPNVAGPFCCPPKAREAECASKPSTYRDLVKGGRVFDGSHADERLLRSRLSRMIPLRPVRKAIGPRRSS